MSKQDYTWKRFWCPRSGSINLADDGYLCYPDGEWGKTYNPDLVTLEAIADVPCLVLLGEPGIGKSQELENLRRFTAEHIDEDDQILSLDLEDCSEEKLYANLFKSKTFIDWIDGTHRLYLFLDSLDQGWLIIQRLPTLLAEEFRKLDAKKDFKPRRKKDFKPRLLYLFVALKTGFLQKVPKIKDRPNLSRLYIRIACRTAVSSPIESNFSDLWSHNLGRYDLTPLYPNDVKNALEAHNLDSDVCLKEIVHKGLMPLAIKPITLQFLIKKLQRNNGQLLQNQTIADIYLDGCRELCREPKDETRHPLKPLSNLEIDQRLMISARIAAVTMLCLRPTVWVGKNLGDDDPTKDVLVRELLGQCEKTNSEGELKLKDSMIAEVLDTALFTSHESNRMGWAHQTYAEFLAAWYLKQHNLSLDKILGLILHPDRRVVPQLQETTAWLAGMMPEIFQEVMKTDPDVLLQSNIQATTNSDRSALVGNLLRLYDEDKLLYGSLNNYRDYKKLTHPGLSEQLRLCICDAAKSLHARYVAIDIAEACEQRALQNELADIALNFSEPFAIRRNAASAICRIGDASTKERLKSLVLVDSGDDPDDDIKGYALKAVYPTHITTQELLNALTRPKAKILGGTYQRFIENGIVGYFQPADLLIALEWVEQKPYLGLEYPFQQLVDAILFKAWECLDAPEILQIFARIAIARWCNHEALISDRHDPPFENVLIQNDEKRHKLLKTIVSILPSLDQKPLWLFGSRTGIVLQKDILWMLESIQQCETEQEMSVWSSLIRRAFRYPEQMPEEAKAILDVSQENLILHNEFSFWLKTIDLDSAEAIKIWTNYLQEQAWQSHQDTPSVEPPPVQRVINCLDSFETDHFQAWWDLNLELTLLPTSQYYDDICRQPDITELPGWKDADALTRIRIIKAAEIFIQNWKSESSRLNLHKIDVAAYKALRLLLIENSDYLLTLSFEIWKQFSRIILLVYSYTSESKYVERHYALMKIAYHHAPQEALDTFIALVDEDNRKHGDIHTIEAFRGCWDDKSLSALSKKLMDKALSPQSLGRLLEVLLVHRFEKAIDIAKSFIPLPLPSDQQERSRAVFAAIALMLHTRDAGWSVMLQVIQQDPNFGREIFKKISYLVKWDGTLELKLQESYIADLYIFLIKEFPEAKAEKQVYEDSDSSKNKDFDANEINLNDYEVDEEDSINIWKSYIPQRLQERGTKEACEALERIIHELPELKDQLQWRLLEAEALTRRQTWQPPKPEEILQIIFDPDKCLVQNGHHLLEVLIESLNRLELELQGETSACRDLWDKDMGRDNLFRPIDENAFSDYVKRFLDRDLKSRAIIANREVELRRSYGGRPGERTDIHVDAILKRPNGEAYDSITAIIEVKGCWHPEVQTAMKSQLVERYLADNFCKYGLYLIGWFSCQQWNNQDSRKNKTPKMGIDEVKKQFDEQAETLSSSGNIVRAYVLNTALR